MALDARGGSGMREESSLPERSAQDRGEGRRRGRDGAETAAPNRAPASQRASPALPSIRAALTAALRQRVAPRAVGDQGSLPRLVGHICEQCWDAPAIMLQPAPWGGEMGVCGACQPETPTVDEDPQAG